MTTRTPTNLAAHAAFVFLTSLAYSQTPADPAATAAPDDEIVQLSEFSVSAASDKGYRAGNSVSATRVNTPIKDLPFSVNAFTQQFITDIGARDLFDVAQFAPSVTSAGREFNAGNTVYTIRGFDQGPQRNGFTGTNEAYVDTVSIERVEVVKGPASVLYGQVAPGGIVNYVTKRPTPKRFAEVGGQLGTDNYWRTTLDVNQPLVGKTLMLRFNAALDHAIENVDRADSNTTVIAPSLLWQITDRMSFVLDYQSFTRRETPPGYYLPNMQITGLAGSAANGGLNNLYDPGFLTYYPLPRDFNYASSNDYRHTDNEFVNGEFTIKLSDRWTARANANWSRNRSNHKLTGVGVVTISVPPGMTAAQYAEVVLNNREAGLLAPSATLPRRARFQQTWGHTTSGQIEAAGNYKLSWATIKPLVGVFALDLKTSGRLREINNFFPAWNLAGNASVNPLLNPGLYETNFDENSLPFGAAGSNQRTLGRARAGYGILNTSFFQDRLMTIVGARYNKVDSQATNLINQTVAPKFEANKTTPQLGVGYKVTDDLMVYGSYSESFVLNAAFLQNAGVPSTAAVPTTSKGYEIGVKTDFFGGRVSSTVAVFQIDQQDRLLTFNTFSSGGSTLANSVQGTLDRSEGIEAELTYSPLDNWQIYASGSITDVYVKEAPANYSNFLGTSPEASVKYLANFWSRYSFRNPAVKGLWVGAGFNYTGDKAQRLNNPRLYLPADMLYNAALGYDWTWNTTKLTATLNWKNITDEEYFPANQQQGLPERFVLSVVARF
jgi:iron complex outermembrane recepter protein